MTSALGHNSRARKAIDPPMRPSPTMPIFEKIGGRADCFAKPGCMTGSSFDMANG
jgi:hypothetical protein